MHAELTVRGNNDALLESVTGQIDVRANGDVWVDSVSGNVRLRAQNGGDVEVDADNELLIRAQANAIIGFGWDDEGEANDTFRLKRRTNSAGTNVEHDVIVVDEAGTVLFFMGSDTSVTVNDVAAILNPYEGVNAGAPGWIWLSDGRYMRIDSVDPGTDNAPSTSRFVAHAPFPVQLITGAGAAIPGDLPQGFIVDQGATGATSYMLPATGPWITGAEASPVISIMAESGNDITMTVSDTTAELIYWNGTSSTSLSITGPSIGDFITLLMLGSNRWIVIAASGSWS